MEATVGMVHLPGMEVVVGTWDGQGTGGESQSAKLSDGRHDSCLGWLVRIGFGIDAKYAAV